MTATPPDCLLLAIGLRLGSVALFATMYALMKLAEHGGAELAEIVFFRQTFALPLVTVWIAATAGLGTIRTRRIGAHALRATIGLVAMGFTFGTVLLLPLAEATTIQFTLPIFATILGALVLREPTGRHRWAAVIAGFVGVLIVSRPGSGDIPPLGAIAGLTAALLSAFVSILLRQIGRTESAGTTVFWFSALSVPPLALLYSFHLHAHPPGVWALLVVTGLVGGGAQLLMTASLRLAPVSLVVPMDYSGLVWATLYGWLLFGVWPTPSTWLGAPVIVASGLYIVWRERIRHQQQTRQAIGS